MSTAKARLMRRVRRYLSIWKVNIGLDNDLGLTDINSDAEDFCCGLLNIMLDAQFQNMNLLQMNYMQAIRLYLGQILLIPELN